MAFSSLQKWIAVAAAALAAALGWKFLLPVALPFLLSAALALAAEPLVKLLQKKLKLRRSFSTAIGVTTTLVLLSAILVFVTALLLRQVTRLAGKVPDLTDTARQGLNSVEHYLPQPRRVRGILNGGVGSTECQSMPILALYANFLI